MLKHHVDEMVIPLDSTHYDSSLHLYFSERGLYPNLCLLRHVNPVYSFIVVPILKMYVKVVLIDKNGFLIQFGSFKTTMKSVIRVNLCKVYD